MSLDAPNIPLALKRQFRASLLTQLLAVRGLDRNELSLFEWFEREHEALIGKMLQAEKGEVQRQIDAQIEDVNDSGIVAVEYFVKRSRYSHVIFLASLLETYLDEACRDLANAIGDQNVPFRLEELSGEKWSKRRKFLERYGHFQIPQKIWSPVSVISLIRNILVHENGNCTQVGEKVRQECSGIPGINLDGFEVTIDPSFISFSLSSLRDLVEFLDARLKGAIERGIQLQSVAESESP